MNSSLSLESLRACHLADMLERMLQKTASDLHLKSGSPPGFRVGLGIETEGTEAPLSAEDIEKIVEAIVPERLRTRLIDADAEIETAFSVEGVSRYRASIFRQRGMFSIVLRRIPVEVPDFFRLGLPDVARKLALLNRGLVLVTGPTGSGKSTTLAALIDYLNQETSMHIITLEEPIEFIHADKKCFITQREIGEDSASFHQALRRALRQDPDVLMIGEMRDVDTISLALGAAETGHLVFATLHTTGAVQTVDRVLDAFPAESRSRARIQLAATLQGVISQLILPKVRGGRTAAFEVLIASDAVRNLIREDKTHQIASLLQTGSSAGMQTMESSLAEMVRNNVITAQTALDNSSNPETLQQFLSAAPQRNQARTGPDLRRTPVPQPATTPAPREPIPEVRSTEEILEKLRRS